MKFITIRIKDIKMTTKHFLILFLLALYANSLLSCVDTQKADTNAESNRKNISFKTDEGTWMNVDISPDGQTILFDLLGDIYTIPVKGGEAKRIRGNNSWDLAPRFSPDGNKIAFISDFTGGEHQICFMNSDGTNPKQISDELSAHGAPCWSPDGKYIIGNKDFNDGSPLKKYSSEGLSPVEMNKDFGWFGPVYSKSTSDIYFSQNDQKGVLQIFKMNEKDSISQITHSGELNCLRPQLSNNGKWLAYGLKEKNKSWENIDTPIGKTSLMIRDLQTGVERKLLENIENVRLGIIDTPKDIMPGYTFTPDNESIIIAFNGKIHSVNISTGLSNMIPFSVEVSKDLVKPFQLKNHISLDSLKIKQIKETSFSPNGKLVAFSAIGKLWLHDLNNGETIRLTNSSINEFTPKFSPDGKTIIYGTWSDKDKGAIRIYNFEEKESKKITAVPGFYINPTWSPDGLKIAYIASLGKDKNYEDLIDSKELGVYLSNITNEPALRIADYQRIDAENILAFSPLYFDNKGEKIFFTENGENSVNKFTCINLIDKSTSTVMEVHPSINYISPSFDGKSALLVGKYDLYLYENLDKIKAKEVLSYEDIFGANPKVNTLSKSGATFVEWQKDGSILWNFTNEIYKWKLGYKEPNLLSKINLYVKKPTPSVKKIAYTNARIVTMDNNKVIENGYMIVEAGRIKKIGKASEFKDSKDIIKIDLSGKTIIPGLVDVHAHFHYGRNNTFTDTKPEYVANLAYGVTTIFDPASFTVKAFSLAEMVESGEIIGPRVFSTGAGVLSNEYNWGHVQIDSYQDAKRVVEQLKKSGAIMIKSYTQPTREIRKWLVQAANESGIGVTLESGLNQMLYYTGIVDGHNSIEHEYLYMPIYNDVIQFYAQSGVQITTTFITDDAEDILYGSEGFKPDNKLKRYRNPKRLEKYKTKSSGNFNYSFVQTAKDLKKVINAGGLVSVGSHGEMSGLGMHWEMWYLAMGGLSPDQVLKAGTITAAKKIGLDEEIGSIERGKIADFLILNTNPLNNIRNTADIKYVVKEGTIYDAESMTQLYPNYKILPKQDWITDQDYEKQKTQLPEKLSINLK
jgi:imidazolonepropionase-like amidohydrolase/Tol biopolymer transport system component